MTDEQLKALKVEFDELVALRDNLKATQERCTQLINEKRELERQLARLKTRWMALLDELPPV